MNVASDPSELAVRPRAVAIGSFDGVHRGHRAVVDAVRATGLEPTVITFDPHPRIALGNRVELLTTLERRLELLEEAGVSDVLVAAFTPELQQLTPEKFVDRFLRATGVDVVVAGEDFRFGVRRSGDLALLERLGFEVVVVPELPGVSSTAIRSALVAGELNEAAEMLGRPFELDGVVVAGDQRGGTLGYPDCEPPARAGSRVPAVRDLRRLRPRPSCGDLDRDESALRRLGAANRAVSPRLRRRSLRKASRGRAVGAASRRGGVRERGGARRADRARRRGDEARSQAVAR